MSDVASAPRAVVVEDDADARTLLATILRRTGFEVHTAATAAEGIAAVHALNPVLTTVDMLLPGMDGRAAIRQIRTFSSTVVMVVSGLDHEADVLSGLAAGADAYLVKPVRPAEFRARIRAALRRAGGPVVLAPHQAAPSEPEPADLPQEEPASVLAPVAPPEDPAPASVETSEPGRYPDDTIVFGSLVLYPYDVMATLYDQPVALTDLEFDLLEVVLQADLGSLDAPALAAMVRDGEVSTESVAEVEVAMVTLMSALGETADQPRWIVRTEDGYRRAPGIKEAARRDRPV